MLDSVASAHSYVGHCDIGTDLFCTVTLAQIYFGQCGHLHGFMLVTVTLAQIYIGQFGNGTDLFWAL
jgi:hypothetical protein